jgi:hypothetical protein
MHEVDISSCARRSVCAHKSKNRKKNLPNSLAIRAGLWKLTILNPARTNQLLDLHCDQRLGWTALGRVLSGDRAEHHLPGSPISLNSRCTLQGVVIKFNIAPEQIIKFWDEQMQGTVPFLGTCI